MNLDSTNRWLTLAANIGVMAGIIFLAFELHQNNVATQLEAAGNLHSTFTEIELFIAGNPEFADVLGKGRLGEDTSSIERLRLSAFYASVLRQWQFMHFQFLSGVLNEDTWQPTQEYYAQIIGEDLGLFNRWQTYKHQFSPAFNGMIESITVERH